MEPNPPPDAPLLDPFWARCDPEGASYLPPYDPAFQIPPALKVRLTEWIRRLEAATSRLEDMASSTVPPPAVNGAAPPSSPAPPAIVAPPKAAPEPVPESVEDFDAFVNGSVKKYISLSDALGGPIAAQVGRP